MTVAGPSGTETALSDVVSSEIVFQREILTEAFLGETTDRKDDIFKGIEGNLEVQIESQDVFRFIQRINDRSKRRTPADEVFNIVTTLQMPNGQRPRVLLENCFFGEVNMNTGGRQEYVTLRIPFGCSDGRFLF